MIFLKKSFFVLLISGLLSGCVKAWVTDNGWKVSGSIRVAQSKTKDSKAPAAAREKSVAGESMTPLVATNICKIFERYPHWYEHVRRTERNWGLPANVQLAIIRHESAFDANARPIRKVRRGFSYSYEAASSAYGYAQAKTVTWREYKQLTRKSNARRDRFSDAVDFIGWYNHRSHRMLGIKKHDAFRLYLAYHEGQGGYKRRTYRKKKWLVEVARRVEKSSKVYRKQIRQCRRKIIRQLAANS